MNNTLPCGHSTFRILEEKAAIRMIRCATPDCHKLWVIMPGLSIIPVEAIFTITDIDLEAKGAKL
jgi:hypothetical protein